MVSFSCMLQLIIGCFQIHPMIIFECSILQKPYVNSYAISISERQYLIIMLNSQNFLILLIFSSDFIRTDAVGTHLVENSIGIARQTSNDPRWERILTLFYHSEIRKSIANKYSLKLHVQNRLNDSGCN